MGHLRNSATEWGHFVSEGPKLRPAPTRRAVRRAGAHNARVMVPGASCPKDLYPKSGRTPPQFGRVGAATVNVWGLLQVPQAPPSPLAPSPGGAFLCGTNPRARNLSRCGMPKERIPQCTLRTLAPASAGLFLLEPVAARRELSCFRDQSPVTQPRPLRWGLSLSRDRRDRGQNLVVGWRPARLSGADHEGNDAQG